MKIERDLRLAIKAASAAIKRSDTWSARQQRKTLAIRALLASRPDIAREMRHAHKLKAQASKIRDEANRIADKYGLCLSNPDLINNEEVFVKAGGKLPEDRELFDPDKVMRDILAANHAEAMAILKKHGINWS